MAPALPRAGAALLLFLFLAATAWAKEEASSPISLPPAPTASPLLHQDSVADYQDSALPPVSQPPSSSSSAIASSPSASSPPASSPSTADAVKDSPPVPAPSVSPAHAPSHPHSASTPAPAPAPKESDDKEKEEHNKAPAPAPAAAETIKATNGAAAGNADDGDGGSHSEMNGGKKAGVVVGAFTAAAVVGLAAFVWKKRRANIRRARYADYSARLELV